MSVASSPRESLAEILVVERVSENEFEATLEDFWGAAQGGTRSPARRSPRRTARRACELRSLHACYLRPLRRRRRCAARRAPGGRGGEATRQVRIEGDGLLCQVIDELRAARRRASAYQDAAPASALPRARELCPAPTSRRAPRAGASMRTVRSSSGARIRACGRIRRATPRGAHVEWMRPRKPLPDDPRVQMAALVFLGDFYAHWPFERRIGRGFAQDRFQPLDLALRCTGPPHWNDWWLVESTSEVAQGGCALARRRIFTRDGALVASAAQAALVAGPSL